MASNYVVERERQSQFSRAITFAGDGVRLAGQIDYPQTPANSSGTYPLLFILPHAGCTSRDMYLHYTRTALNSGYAVFRWDKRGTGRSGAGGRGSVVQDAVLAFETALDQPTINARQTVILAQSEASLMLGESFGLFARLQHPAGVILTGNMLKPAEILAIQAPLLLITGQNDWNNWKLFAREAAEAHKNAYEHGATFYVAEDADRMMVVNDGDRKSVHFGAQRIMRDWLTSL